MASTSRRTEAVLGLGRLLEEHKGEDTVVLDLRSMSSWTDYFVISTVRSHAHLGGLVRALHEYFDDHDFQPLSSLKRAPEDGWVLLDCGDVAVHLMDREIREFYSLERLYFKAEVIFHSSKSS
jgi:ribosome-associated protein